MDVDCDTMFAGCRADLPTVMCCFKHRVALFMVNLILPY